jgi:hypothetical protein
MFGLDRARCVREILAANKTRDPVLRLRLIAEILDEHGMPQAERYRVLANQLEGMR